MDYSYAIETLKKKLEEVEDMIELLKSNGDDVMELELLMRTKYTPLLNAIEKLQMTY